MYDRRWIGCRYLEWGTDLYPERGIRPGWPDAACEHSIVAVAPAHTTGHETCATLRAQAPQSRYLPSFLVSSYWPTNFASRTSVRCLGYFVCQAGRVCNLM